MSDTINICLSNKDAPEGGAWLSLPASAAQLQDALQSIGADIGRQDFTITAFDTTVPAVDTLLIVNPDTIVNASLDELNFLAVKMDALDKTQRLKLDAIAESPYRITELERLIDYDFNTDCFVHIPSVFNHIQLGEYYLEESGMIEMPEEWIGAINIEMLGQLAADAEMGVFTDKGYILPSGDEWQHDFEDDRHIPDEYRLTGKEDATREKLSIKDQLKADKAMLDKTGKTPEVKPQRSAPELE